MATTLFSSKAFTVIEVRGGGIVLRNETTQKEVFFQPGDDAQSMRDTIEAVEELDERLQEKIFNIACEEYF